MAASAREAAMSKVTFTICEAARLRKTQMFGTQDPFVVVKMKNNPRVKTRVDEDGGTAPSWQQVLPSFTFQPGEDNLVHFEIWNENSLSDTLIGECSARLSKLRQAASTPSQSIVLNVLHKGKPYKSAILRIEAKFDEQPPAGGSQARLGGIGAGLLSAHFAGSMQRRRPSLAALAAVHGNAAQNLQPPPPFSPLAAGAGSSASARLPAPSPAPAPQVAVAAPVAPATGLGFRGAAAAAAAGSAFRRGFGRQSSANSSGMGIGFRAGYQAQGTNAASASTMANVALAAQRFRAGNSSQKPPQAASFAVLPSPVAHNSNWQVARQQTQRMGRAVAAFTATALPSAANSQYRSASVSSLPSETSSVNTGGVGLPRKDLNLTPQHNVNGSAFALTFDDGSLGLSLVPTTYGYAMISEPAEVGSQAGKYDLLPGDYVIAVGKFPLAKPGYMGVDGIVAALGQLTRPLRIAFFRFDFNKAHGRSGQTTPLGVLPQDRSEPPSQTSQPSVPSVPPPPPSAPEPEDPPESDWAEAFDKISGKKYYYNKITNDVSWTPPEPQESHKLPSRLAISPEARREANVDPAAAAVEEHNKRFPKTSADGSALFVKEHSKATPEAPKMTEEEIRNKKIQQFMMMVGVGACPRPRIIELLEIAGGDVNRAINYFFSNGS
eukprot:g4817.t1